MSPPDALALADAPEPSYPSAAVSDTHPARLRAWASMHGVGSWSDEPFRYLEIGCGNAANLLPLAAQFPRSEFVGVDRDEAVIARGRRAAEACGLPNVRLVAADLRAFSPGEAPFDYVVAHGVYSWIPPDAQARLLSLAREALAPLGVAYLSYNTFPGWGMRRVIRDAMLDAAGGAAGMAGLRAAKGRMAELKRRMVRTAHPYSQLLASELDLALSKDDGYLLWEHLAEHNEPVYVKDLLRRASESGLAYVCELLPATPEGDVDLPLIAELTASGMSRADAEQCLDLLAYRQFRATLLCRDEVPVAPTPAFEPLAQTGFFCGWLDPTSEEPLLGPGKRLAFRTRSGVEIASKRPLLKAALLVIARAWPASLRAQPMIQAAVESLRERGLLAAARVDQAEVRATMGELLGLCRRRLLEVLPWAPAFRSDVPSRPAVRPVTRFEAARSAAVTLPSHEPMSLKEPMRTVVCLLDGTRDVRALVAELSNRVASGELSLDPDVVGADPTRRLVDVLTSAVSRTRALGLLDVDPEEPPAPALDAGAPRLEAPAASHAEPLETAP